MFYRLVKVELPLTTQLPYAVERGQWDGVAIDEGKDAVRFSLTVGRGVGQMNPSRVLGLIFLVTTMYLISTNAISSAEDIWYIQMQTAQTSQSARQGQPLQGSQRVRPSLRERDAISEVLTIKPRPKTLTGADIKYLKELRDKPAWFSFEQRIVHEIWAEVSGKEWRDTEGAASPRSKPSP